MKLLRIAVPIVTLFVVIFVSVLFAPKYLKPRVEEEISRRLHDKCPTCEFAMASMGWAWRGMALRHVQFRAGEKDGPRVIAEIACLAIRPDLFKLLRGEIEISRIHILRPEVTFRDIEKVKRPVAKRASPNRNGPSFPLRRLVIERGKFKYIREVRGTHAELTIHKIQADAVIKDETLNALAEGQFGTTGDFDLRVAMPIEKRPLEVDIDLSVRDQNLADLTAFFQPNAGVELKGILRKGHASTRLRGSSAQTSLKAEYEKFELKLHKMHDREKWQAFFISLGAKIAMKKENTQAAPHEQREVLATERESGESLVHFVLQSWKKAAIELAM